MWVVGCIQSHLFAESKPTTPEDFLIVVSPNSLGRQAENPNVELNHQRLPPRTSLDESSLP